MSVYFQGIMILALSSQKSDEADAVPRHHLFALFVPFVAIF